MTGLRLTRRARDISDDELLFTDEGPVLAQQREIPVDRTGDIVSVVVTSDRDGLLITYVSAARLKRV